MFFTMDALIHPVYSQNSIVLCESLIEFLVFFFFVLDVPFPEGRVNNRDGESSISSESSQQVPATPRQSAVDLRTVLVPPRGSSTRNGPSVMNRFVHLDSLLCIKYLHKTIFLPRIHSRSSSLDMRWNSLRAGCGTHNHLAAWFGGLHGRYF